jgi:hypothetical protein
MGCYGSDRSGIASERARPNFDSVALFPMEGPLRIPIEPVLIPNGLARLESGLSRFRYRSGAVSDPDIAICTIFSHL